MRQRHLHMATGHRHRAAAFTLLEMVVVVAVLGLATALVAPAMLRGLDSWRRQAALDGVLDQVRALPGRARGTGRAIVVDETSLKGPQPPLRVADAWSLSVPAAWKVHATGVCEGGEIRMSNAYSTRTVRVTAPFCDPVLE